MKLVYGVESFGDYLVLKIVSGNLREQEFSKVLGYIFVPEMMSQSARSSSSTSSIRKPGPPSPSVSFDETSETKNGPLALQVPSPKQPAKQPEPVDPLYLNPSKNPYGRVVINSDKNRKDFYEEENTNIIKLKIKDTETKVFMGKRNVTFMHPTLDDHEVFCKNLNKAKLWLECHIGTMTFESRFSHMFKSPQYLPPPLPPKPQLSTVALSKIRSFGTKDHPTDHTVTPQDEIYEYTIFRGSDIKDIRICQPPKPQTVRKTLLNCMKSKETKVKKMPEIQLTLLPGQKIF